MFKPLWLGVALLIVGVTPATAASSFETREGTWMSVDVSPDGRTLLFDVLGDVFQLDANGGQARALLAGPSFETQAVYSPDGKRIAFVSDRSGSENLWIADVDGRNARSLSQDTQGVFVSPAWAPDGKSVFVTRFDSRSRLNFSTRGGLWVFDVNGGGSALQGEVESKRTPGLGAAPSPDGQSLYFSMGDGGSGYDIFRRDLRSGRSILLISGRASATRLLQPKVTPDGSQLIYGSDIEGRTELRVRNLRDGSDRRLAFPIETSLGDMSPAFQGLLPGYAVTPDSSAVIMGYGGKLHRIDLRSGVDRVIPFQARFELPTELEPKPQWRDETGPVRARMIQAPSLSPDGKQLAFIAFGKLYVRDLASGANRRVTDTPLREDAVAENYPTYSPDGRWIAYASWSRSEGGHLWRVRSDGRGKPQRVTQAAAYFRKPVYAADGKSIIALRSATYDQQNLLVERGMGLVRHSAQELVRVSAEGGEARLISYLPPSSLEVDLGQPHRAAGADAVLTHTPDGLLKVPLDGSDAQPVLKVETSVGVYAELYQHKQPVDDVTLSPDGRWVLVLNNSQLHLLAVPAVGGDVQIDLDAPSALHRQITQIGADSFGWSADSREIFWTVGSTFHRLTLAQALASQPADAGCVDDRYAGVRIDVEIPRATQQGTVLLRGAKAVTMRGDEIIERADVLIEGNRIAAIGATGMIQVPANAEIRDLTGKTITPGFVDTHAHYYHVGRQVIDYRNWEFPAQLAYGVTATIDPQSFTSDFFVYLDLSDAGVISAPRLYTTGPGIHSWNNLASAEQAKCVLRRYRDFYRTPIVKSYMIGSRTQRQYMVTAARELGMRLVTENWGIPRYSLTHAMDGFASNEHAADAIDYYDDVAQLYARTGAGFSPTTLIGGAAGPMGVDYFLARRDPMNDAKLNRFVPRNYLRARIGRVRWEPEEHYIFQRLAASAAKILRAGGTVGLGAHGELPGLGYHWEMQAYAKGGMTPHEVLQTATRNSARMLGREQEFGTLEAGKYADLIVFGQDPLLDIANAESIEAVLKNGRLQAL
ncbi:amidohydrolase family protein [Steroidobacter sp.]|uniref:amidohydrolase family protein n=1 Tax=Steroidobacter sp. TaxID=1978227 RepID=UPI001A5099AC|nr:amidohydrolase family protein [Steroidobacter sp.]MBL8269087.1 PD40 domain-containing protein [Steroidobacter sp.]